MFHCQLPALSGMRSCLLQLYKQRSPKDSRGKKMMAITVTHIWTIYGCTDESCLVLWFRRKQFKPKLSLPFSRVGDWTGCLVVSVSPRCLLGLGVWYRPLISCVYLHLHLTIWWKIISFHQPAVIIMAHTKNSLAVSLPWRPGWH